MNLVLATTWNPRGELPRFERLLPRLEQVYSTVVISFPPQTNPDEFSLFVEGKFSAMPNLSTVITQDWSWGRYVALQEALNTSASHIHYADMDRLLRWVERQPREWEKVVESIQKTDYLVVGRSNKAYATHPKAIIHTEALSNRVISHFVGRVMDVSAGSKGFSRQAAQFIIASSKPGRALGTDGEWTVLLYRGGFHVDYIEVDGLDWESADRYKDRAAGLEDQITAATLYDADPENWQIRLKVAKEIIEAGLEAAMIEFEVAA